MREESLFTSQPTDLRGHYAGFVSRLTAFLIDHAIIIGVLAITTAVATYLFSLVGLSVTQCQPGPSLEGSLCIGVKGALLLFGIGFAPLYTILFWVLIGQTPGKYLVGLRIYRLDGQPLTLARSTRRYVGYVLSFLLFGLGFFWMILDDRRQGFHDKFADTCVVYVWDAFQNQRLLYRMSRLFRHK